MSYDREPVLAWLEEDNVQRSYFRLMPLLAPSGDLREEAQKNWPNDGALRIVPDRNEQTYFKDRMRSMGSFCLMNLDAFPPEVIKIRTNKNYRPERGEVNRFIIYSDAVKELPPHTFFEVLTGTPEEASALAAKAATPLFIILNNDTFYGPVERSAPSIPQPLGEMTATVYVFPCPDGTEHTFMCTDAIGRHEPVIPAAVQPAAPVQPAAVQPVPAAQPVPAVADAKPIEAVTPAAEPQPEHKTDDVKPASDTILPIGKELNILDETKSFDQTIDALNTPVSGSANLLATPAAPAPMDAPEARAVFSGTPLNRSAGVRTSTPRPKDRVQEVVSSQLHIARNDPPAPPLPEGAVMVPVVNPVETACQSLDKAWALPEARRQLLDHVLSLPGVGNHLSAVSSKSTPLQKAMLRRLDDIEADRLCALIELGHLEGDIEASRKKVLDHARREARRQLEDIEKRSADAHADFDATQAQLSDLQAQADALRVEIARLQGTTLPEAAAQLLAKAALTAPSAPALPLSGRIGRELPDEELISLMQESFRLSGLECPRNLAVALLALMVSCRRIGIACQTPAPVATLLNNIALRMGWTQGFAVRTHADERPVVTRAATDTTPIMVLSTMTFGPAIPGITSLLLTIDARAQQSGPQYMLDQWPILSLQPIQLVPTLSTEHAGTPVALSLGRAVEADRTATDVLAPIMKELVTLSGSAADELCHFVSIASGLMEGGLPAACDWAIRLWLLPLMHMQRKFDAVKPLLEEYPMSAGMV